MTLATPSDAQNRKALFLRACRLQPVPRVPVWMMRQAGRYLPEYRALREKHAFLEVAKTPELAAEVSLQPFRRLGVDAVIVFSDILIPAEAMGAPIELGDAGPIIHSPIRSAAQIAALSEFDPEIETQFLGDAIRLLCRTLGPDVPVLGFAAAPWTLACYLIQGCSSDGFPAAKAMLAAEPELLRALLDKIARATARYLKAQIAAGAAAVQLFDTWAGELTASQYREFELPATQFLISELAAGDTPVILFSKNSRHLLEDLAGTGANVLSVDWRVDLGEAQKILNSRVALQGNVDPAVLLTSEHAIAAAAYQAVEQTGGLGHILNLGHGILSGTPVENALAFVRAGQSATLTLGSAPGAGRGATLDSSPSAKTNGDKTRHSPVSSTVSIPSSNPALIQVKNAGERLFESVPAEFASAAPNLTLALDRERFRISDEFLARYNRPGPRYTSYPTAPVWQDDFGPADLEEVYTQAAAADTPVSLYMHLPFCESLCLFCACNVVITKDHSAAPPYLTTLKREIEHVAAHVDRSRPVVQFHWGGGTPTYLTPAQMEDLFGFAAERFSFARDAEIGIEVDPRVTSVRHLEALRRLGFNRLSLGIQDFDPEVQQAIHRVQPLEMTADLIAQARALGFGSLNVDLIYGLPYQTAQRFAHTVDEVLTLAPDRVAMFSYAHVPWLRKQQGALGSHLPEGLEKFRIFCTGLESFVSAGYQYIGMDHFARPDDELAVAQRDRTLHRNFQGYTTKGGADLYGMGVSAISGIGAAYAQNHRDIAGYTEAVERRGIATMRGYRLSPDDVLRRAVINRLLCHGVIRKDEIAGEFGIEFDSYFAAETAALAPFVEDGLVTVTAGEIQATLLGRIFIRNVAMLFDPYLEKQRLAERPLFSKTL
jgi:oxygen-independent coproporphyrinogen-3 oxidase